MEALGGVLGGLGGLGLVAAILMGLAVLCFLPFFAILDCLVSRRSGSARLIGAILLVLTWGLGSVIYGLFLTRSRALRAFTMIVVFGVGVVFFISTVSLGTGAGIHGRITAEERNRREQEIVSRFQPSSIAADSLAPFHALQFTYDRFGPATAALARFTLSGPDYATARDVDKSVRQVAFDAEKGQYFALTGHEFGTIETSAGRFARIAVDSSLDFSWPKGIAFDKGDGKVYVMTCHVFTRLYRHDPRTGAWQRLPTEIHDLPLVALAYSRDDGCLYGLEAARPDDPALRRLHRFNTQGATLGAIELHPAIPFKDDPESTIQLVGSGGKLVLMLPSPASAAPGAREPSRSSENRILVVDPASGEVFRPDQRSEARSGVRDSASTG